MSIGVGLMLCAYFLFATADTTTKWLGLAGWPALQMAFMRYAVQTGLSSAEGLGRGITAQDLRGNVGLLLLRGFALSSSTVGVFYALQTLSLSLFSAIMFSTPIFVSLLSQPLLGERVGPWRWAAIVLGFVGVLVMVRPFDADFQWAAVYALYSALGMATYLIITRRLAHRTRPHVMQWITGVVGTVGLAPLAWWHWQPLTASVLGLMFWVGFASWLGHELVTRAHQRVEASALTPYSYVFILYMSLAGWWVYDELPDQYTALGAFIIIFSGLFIWYRERINAQRAKAVTTAPSAPAENTP